tara:strand:- start:337 stop:756 length:420 start_codon:yes stop_codon:yes gene_type:complete
MDEKKYYEAIMDAYKRILLAYQRHVGKDNMMLILHETGVDIIEEDDGRLGGKLPPELLAMLQDMRDAKGQPCPKYPIREVHDFSTQEGMNLVFPHYNMHYVFPDKPEAPNRNHKAAFRVRSYGNPRAIEEVINANMVLD